MRFLTSICLLLIFIQASSDYTSEFTTLSHEEAKKKWGSTPFNKNNFKTIIKHNYKERQQMASEIIKKQIYSGKKLTELYKDLGQPKGYFSSDLIPAYILTDPRKRKTEAYQLIFEPDDTGKAVKRVLIYKTCCY